MARTNLNGIEDLSVLSAEDVDGISEDMGKKLAQDRITTHQIRNVYSAVQSIRISYEANGADENIHRRLVFLKPKMAYAAGRQPKLKPFRQWLVQAVDGVTKESKDRDRALQTFFSLLEFTVAYHRFHGGKDA